MPPTAQLNPCAASVLMLPEVDHDSYFGNRVIKKQGDRGALKAEPRDNLSR
jgi:hypothetical protein